MFPALLLSLFRLSFGAAEQRDAPSICPAGTEYYEGTSSTIPCLRWTLVSNVSIAMYPEPRGI